MPESDIIGEVFNNLPFPLVILTSGWSVAHVNSRFSSLFGRETSELKGIPAGDIFSEIAAAAHDSPWNVSSIVSVTGELINVAFQVTPFASGGYLLLVVPEQEGYGLNAEFAARLAGSVAEEPTRQLSLLGHLAGGVAHDLNNTLTGVLGHIALLKHALGEEQSSLVAAEDGTRKACATARQILEFVRGGESHRTSVELSDVVRKVTRLLGVSLPKNIHIETILENALVYGNESELSQLLINLAINARDAMPRGGKLIIKVSTLLRAPDDIDLALLSVQDSGQGIDNAVRHRVFEPFFTTKGSGKGTGLGLSNVKKTVDDLGGTILFESEIGSGTLFEIRLPLCGEEEEQKAEPSSAPAIRAGTSEHILIVEDEESVRIVMQRSLEHLGYTVEVASNGREGIETFEKNPGAYTLVVLDVMMPEMSGDELFVRLRELRPGIPVLIASGYASDARTRKMLDAGACGYIHKPFGVEDLAAEVRRCIDAFGFSSGAKGHQL